MSDVSSIFMPNLVCAFTRRQDCLRHTKPDHSSVQASSNFTISRRLSLMLNPAYTYVALLIVQAFHLLHHRLAKRHISFAEVLSAAVLCFPPFLVQLPSALFVTTHLLLIAVQIVGSVWIRKLSPDWNPA